MLLGKSSRIFIPIAALLAIVVLAALAKSPKANTSIALTKTYANAAYGFVLKMPEDFSAYPPNESPNRDASGKPIGEAVVLQNSTGEKVQIDVTAAPGSSNVFTTDDLEQMAPYVDPATTKSVQIAPGVIGETFTLTGSAAAYGTSTDVVIFKQRGNLYEVSADSRDRSLFNAIMATWSFI